MSSKGTRASILKKQHFSSHNLETNATTASSGTIKGSRKIEFNRKKSIKEFIVGEETDTIWGNSYEVSTDGTPSSGLGDVTLGSSTCRSLVDEQNKENRMEICIVKAEEEQRPSPNSTNGSWDLSLTLADDERRRIKSETMGSFSHSLNTTDRLMMDPIESPSSKLKPKKNASQTLLACGVQAIDISPLKGNFAVSPKKSPRKIMYYNSRENFYVEINDVPPVPATVAEPVVPANGECDNVGGGAVPASRILFQTPTKNAMRGYAPNATSQPTARSTSSFNVSETWNSHPQAMMNQSNGDGLANVSSDVDTTLAITNTVAKLLEGDPSLTIPMATEMDLDESITTAIVPTNALARARPSFLPSQRNVDEPQIGPQIASHDTPNETNSVDVSSPIENLRPAQDMSVENIPQIPDLKKQPTMVENVLQKSTTSSLADVEKSTISNVTTASRHALSMDFGISSISLKTTANSPETPASNRPKILRPTLPLMMFNGSDAKTAQTPKGDSSGGRQVKMSLHTERAAKRSEIRRTINNHEDMDTTCRHESSHGPTTQTSNVERKLTAEDFDQSKLAVVRENTAQQTKSYRQTIYDTTCIVEETGTAPANDDTVHRERPTTVGWEEQIEITHDHLPAPVADAPSTGKHNRATIYDNHPIGDQSILIEQTNEMWHDGPKQDEVRGTIHEKISIDTVTHTERNEQEARKTVYPQETMKMDTLQSANTTPKERNTVRKTYYPDDEMMKVDSAVAVRRVEPGKENTLRKTIVCNESIALDVCANVNDDGIDSESSVTCRVYGKNIDEISIHAESAVRKSIDVKIARPTMCSVEDWEPSVFLDESAMDSRRLTTRNVRNMETDDYSFRNPVDGTEMEVVETVTVSVQKEKVEEEGIAGQGTRPEGPETRRRFTTHDAAAMDETNTAHSMERARTERSRYGGEQEDPFRLTESGRRCTPKELGEVDILKADKQTFRCPSIKEDDMDATQIVERNAEENRSHRAVAHSEAGAKARCSSYGMESMEDVSCFNATPPKDHGHTLEGAQQTVPDGFRNESRPSIYQTLVQDDSNRSNHCVANPADLTNYNAFMINHEMSQRGEKQPRQRLTTYYMEGMNEAGLDSTRLSKERGHLLVSQEAIKSRTSTHQVEAMDESNLPTVPPQLATARGRVQELENTIQPVQHHPSPQRENRSCPPQPQQAERSGKSSYHSEKFETPSIGHDDRHSDNRNRRSKLRSIVQHAAIEDMEGFSLLADDDDDASQRNDPEARDDDLRAAEEHRQTVPRSTILFSSTSATTEEQCASKYRPTICYAEAMQEDMTITAPTGKTLEQSIKSSTGGNECRSVMKHYPATPSVAPQRTSSVCMEETMLPIAVRIERRKSAYDSVPIVYSAEHPPSFQGSVRNVDESTTDGNGVDARNNAEEPTNSDGSNRQTVHEPCKIDLTLDARTSIIRNVAIEEAFDIGQGTNRRTIYNSHSIVETEPPPKAGSSPVGEGGGDGVSSFKVPTQVAKKPTKIPGASGKPRQTILITQDMDVDSDADEPDVMESEEHSTLIDEGTEDCVLRCALPTAVGQISLSHHPFREPSVDGLKRLTVQLSEGNVINQPQGRAVTNSSRFGPPSSTVHELSDLSMCNETMRPEAPQIGNITEMVLSLHEFAEPLPLPPMLRENNEQQHNSVSVICRVTHQQVGGEETVETVDTRAQQSLATCDRNDAHSEDEFYDAEDVAADGGGTQPEVDPLSLTKSQHLTMKFIDVEHLERTGNYRASVLVPSTTSKRIHAQLLSSPSVDYHRGSEDDPLHVTALQCPVTTSQSGTPQGPLKKRLRTSNASEDTHPAPSPHSQCVLEAQQAVTVKSEPDEEENLVKQERPTMVEDIAAVKFEEPVEVKEEQQQQQYNANRTMARVGSQTIIADPSVFVIEEDDLLDDESNPPGASFTEESVPEHNANQPGTEPNAGTDPGLGLGEGTTSRPNGTSLQPISVGKLKELSFYRDFANLTIDNLESWDEAKAEEATQRCGAGEHASVECITLSDDDTPSKRTPDAVLLPPGSLGQCMAAAFEGRPTADVKVFDSTIASEVMYELRQEHQPTKSAACCGGGGAPTDECLCRMKRELERRKQACDMVWSQYCAWMEEITQHLPNRKQYSKLQQDMDDDDGRDKRDDSGQPIKSIEEQIEELNWQLLRAKLEQTSVRSVSVEADGTSGDVTTGRKRGKLPINGHFPETPNVVFLYENLQRFLSEQAPIDRSPPTGAPLPAIPRISVLIANKLCTDARSHWHLDCTEEQDDLLMLRHRILRSVVIAVQLQESDEPGARWGEVEEERRIERIQVRECLQEYVHSPKLLLAHTEFMRLAKETTERTLRSTYRTVASLMGLWQRFDELLRRVFTSVNRLLTITRNHDALLCYDAEMERFCVKKYFQRRLDDGSTEPNLLMVHFHWIGSVSASGVSFKRPVLEVHKLLPTTTSGQNRLTVGNGVTKPSGAAGSTDDHTGLMFLECLLWNVAKQFESGC